MSIESMITNKYNQLFSTNTSVIKANDVIISGIIRNPSKNNNNNTYNKELLTPHAIVKNGDYISETINNITYTYIIVGQPINKIGCDCSYLLECQYTTKVLDIDKNIILTYPISLVNENSSISTQNNEYVILRNSSYNIYLKYDEKARRFIEDCVINNISYTKITRIMIDKLAFTINSVNNLIDNGILVLNITSTGKTINDNVDLGICDYYNNYTQSDEEIVNAEIAKYNTNVSMAKTVMRGADVTSIVKTLKIGTTANSDVAVTVTSVDNDNLLTLNNGVVTLTDTIPNNAVDNATTSILTFTKGNANNTLIVNVTIEKQDEVANLVISGDDEIYLGDTLSYTINESVNACTWSINNVGCTIDSTSGTNNNTCNIKCGNSTSYKGKIVILTCSVNGIDYTKEIEILGF